MRIQTTQLVTKIRMLAAVVEAIKAIICQSNVWSFIIDHFDYRMIRINLKQVARLVTFIRKYAKNLLISKRSIRFSVIFSNF